MPQGEGRGEGEADVPLSLNGAFLEIRVRSSVHGRTAAVERIRGSSAVSPELVTGGGQGMS
jgi:hypothetical protein